jgi:hypothetical protein
MKIKFLENNIIGIVQTKKTTAKKICCEGVEYTYVGKSKEAPAIITQVKAFFEYFVLGLVNCLTLCSFKDIRKNLKIAKSELLSGQEIVKYYVINPAVFTQSHVKTDKLMLSKEALFQKGLEESKNVELD